MSSSPHELPSLLLPYPRFSSPPPLPSPQTSSKPRTNPLLLILFPSAVQFFDFAFAENGLTAFKLGQPLASESFIKFVGEERYKPLVNFILHYIADLDIPIKR